MNFGLSDSALEALRKVFSLHPAVREVRIYGSRAIGTFRDGSDIDLVMYGHTLTDSIRNKISQEIDELNLPWMVDLSLIEMIKDPDLLDHIARIGVLFYTKKAG